MVVHRRCGEGDGSLSGAHPLVQGDGHKLLVWPLPTGKLLPPPNTSHAAPSEV